MLNFNRFPGGRLFALTFSYDDGTAHDERLVSVFNKAGVKCTFHLNSAKMTGGDTGDGGDTVDAFVQASRAKELYAGHEIACHTLTHPFPCEIARDRLLFEITQDRLNLERLSGGIIRGMSYPFGQYDRRVIETMLACGIDYSRTVASTGGFGIPRDFMEWHPTCHHNSAEEPVAKFLALVNGQTPARREMRLLNIWGHSYEFGRDDNWRLIENITGRLGGNDKIWYATCAEIRDYVCAVRAMRSSVCGTRFRNPSGISVFAENESGAVFEIKPGAENDCE